MLSQDFIIHFSELEDPRVTNHNSNPCPSYPIDINNISPRIHDEH